MSKQLGASRRPTQTIWWRRRKPQDNKTMRQDDWVLGNLYKNRMVFAWAPRTQRMRNEHSACADTHRECMRVSDFRLSHQNVILNNCPNARRADSMCHVVAIRDARRSPFKCGVIIFAYTFGVHFAQFPCFKKGTLLACSGVNTRE